MERWDNPIIDEKKDLSRVQIILIFWISEAGPPMLLIRLDTEHRMVFAQLLYLPYRSVYFSSPKASSLCATPVLLVVLNPSRIYQLVSIFLSMLQIGQASCLGSVKPVRMLRTLNGRLGKFLQRSNKGTMGR